MKEQRPLPSNTLTILGIHNNNIGHEGAKAIAKALTYKKNTLTKLCIRYYIVIFNNNIGDEGRALLEKNKRKELVIYS